MHSHNHSHDHSHGRSSDASKRIGWAFFLNVVFTIIEFIGGWLTNSTAIMADAVHDLGDSLSIGTSWGLNKLSDKDANRTFSYGYKRFSLLGALINGVVLTIGSVWILFEAIPRLAEPEMPQVEGMLLLSIFGMAVNGFAAYKLSEGNSLNERVLNWHLLEDVLGWVAVFIVSIVLMFKPWAILDPILSIGFTLFILFNVIRNLKQTLMLFLQATPDKAQLERIRDDLLSNEHVSDLHHFHIWSLDGERNVMTVHLVLVGDVSTEHIQTLKNDVQHSLKKYNFEHTTVEFEFADEQCRDEA
ncbi:MULTISPECIES: cation diffusion facilitator family transporter [Alteromonas]|uniref:Cobalt transporter n=2 Tax=Alteromonas TaxID=226 RepID=F2G2B4_ALTMD|nr:MULTISPECIES: cation diffusion facilitator family transporter [Alteromonas]AEA98194.2 cobalt transporter [Alteromonas mediterranea DE]MBU33948.1 cation transporter [Alteromonas sp.]CAH1197610.1 Cadmium, cobalt and zinc/H(+)-K(+) antiporter [Alteromonas mediterranea]HAU26310.1 cation transporter [Alteromonas australica]|tara:strand:+ start:312 stop:1214 length:903 start_codon:yes stop_codon:yes gene_type:complete